MFFTLSGILILSKAVFANAEYPISSTPSEIVTFFKFLHSLNAYVSILLTLEGIFTVSKSVAANAAQPIFSTPSEIVTLFR